jgi:hypothetical protein
VQQATSEIGAGIGIAIAIAIETRSWKNRFPISIAIPIPIPNRCLAISRQSSTADESGMVNIWDWTAMGFCYNHAA